jgi:hypothetical protein
MSGPRVVKSKLGPKQAPPLEVVERKIPIVLGRYQVRVKNQGRDIYLEEFLREALKTKNLLFGRFYLMDEHPWGLHFAPTLEQAIDWFRGRKFPHDGYLSISWGQDLTYICGFCEDKNTEPLQVTKIEKVVLIGDFPFPWEIDGWRVSEIETEKMGKGNPSKIIGLHKTYPIIKWHTNKDKYICQRCADRFKEIGREEKMAGYAIF